MKVLFADSNSWKRHGALQQGYRRVVAEAFRDVRKLLPQVPPDMNFVVQPHRHLPSPETGERGLTPNDHLVVLVLDPDLPFGEESLLIHVRQSVFQQLVFVARFLTELWNKDFIDNCIQEGLATVFVRERASAGVPLWGRYVAVEARQWLEEMEILQEWGRLNPYDYMTRHPDGRRWIGFKVGTYLIDNVMESSGESIERLIALPNDDIRRMSKLDK